jgi:hypothetical protein
MAEGCFEFNFGTSPVLMVFLFISSTPFLVNQFETAGTVSSSPPGTPRPPLQR